MKSVESVNWSRLLDMDSSVSSHIRSWSTSGMSTRNVVDNLQGTEFAGEFRKLVRKNGTNYGRRLARKALKYRGLLV